MHRFHPTSYGVGFLAVRFVKMAVCLRNKPQKKRGSFSDPRFLPQIVPLCGANVIFVENPNVLWRNVLCATHFEPLSEQNRLKGPGQANL